MCVPVLGGVDGRETNLSLDSRVDQYIVGESALLTVFLWLTIVDTEIIAHFRNGELSKSGIDRYRQLRKRVEKPGY